MRSRPLSGVKREGKGVIWVLPIPELDMKRLYSPLPSINDILTNFFKIMQKHFSLSVGLTLSIFPASRKFEAHDYLNPGPMRGLARR